MTRKQSPQSPLFNANDHFYLRKLSKEFLVNISLTYGTRVLKNEELLSVVNIFWNDKIDVVAMKRIYISYYQICVVTIGMKVIIIT